MATTPIIPDLEYQGLTPNILNGSLTPLQVALANYITEANLLGAAFADSPFNVNQAFTDEMLLFTDPGTLTPLTFDPKTGIAKEPDIDRNITAGIGFISVGDDIYLLRRALDCGPDEDRTELVFLGSRFDLADGSFAYYGEMIMAGTKALGAGGSDGNGSSFEFGSDISADVSWAGTDSVFGGGAQGDFNATTGDFNSVA